ncbi:MAG TPA: 4-alpha-glucanotransferase [Acidimicrobiia bacterium]
MASPDLHGSTAAQRSSGLLLHPSSLPGSYGIGDLGPSAHDFVRLLADAGQRYWQMLPLVPIGPGNSPYLSISTFASNSLLISPERLHDRGLLDAASLAGAELGATTRVDYGLVFETKLRLLHEIAAEFSDRADPDQKSRFAAFSDEHGPLWLDDFALFTVLSDRIRVPWTDWPEGLARRHRPAIERAEAEFGDEIEIEKVLQFLFFEQWSDLCAAAFENGVRIVGDMPLYVGHDSADVWAHPESFLLDADGHPLVVSGVPPDYFSETGQRWGTPIYDWDEMAGGDFEWWRARMRRAIDLFDLVRFDHFRGVAGYWAIPAENETAVEGTWEEGPGMRLLDAIEDELGGLPLLAEDLGVITEDVITLRDRFGLPGMRVAQFGFDDAPDTEIHHPATYPENVWGYTGTHDNDTTLGWFWAQGPRIVSQLEAKRRRLHEVTGGDVVWGLIELVAGSRARTSIFPVQDILELGSDARMNTPGTAIGNWEWRLLPGQLDDHAMAKLAEVTRGAGR